MKRILLILCVAVWMGAAIAPGQISMSAPAATKASLAGTYTFQFAELKGYATEFNMSGQQVGFCNNTQPFGYYCQDDYTFDLLAGTFVADGAGRITSGSFAITRDPNTYECSPNKSPTTPCPVVVPSGDPYSSTFAYKTGATVDYLVANVQRTFQAVRNNTGKAPNWTTTAGAANICSNNANNLNTCSWVQILASQTAGDSNNSGTLIGTYTIQANGAGVLTITPTNCNGCTAFQFSIVLSPVSQVGQVISLVGVSQLGSHNKNRSVGTAIRIQ